MNCDAMKSKGILLMNRSDLFPIILPLIIFPIAFIYHFNRNKSEQSSVSLLKYRRSKDKFKRFYVILLLSLIISCISLITLNNSNNPVVTKCVLILSFIFSIGVISYIFARQFLNILTAFKKGNVPYDRKSKKMVSLFMVVLLTVVFGIGIYSIYWAIRSLFNY